MNSSSAIYKENTFWKVLGLKCAKMFIPVVSHRFLYFPATGSIQDAYVSPKRQEGSGIHRHVFASGNWLSIEDLWGVSRRGAGGGQCAGQQADPLFSLLTLAVSFPDHEVAPITFAVV